MGISRGTIKLMAMFLNNKVPSGGKVITYGVQAVQATWGEAARSLKECNYHSLSSSAVPPKQGASQQPIHQDTLFADMLGYSSVESIDYYPDESPTHVLDLNQPVPADLHGRYDLVYDGGTMEHCFNCVAFLQNTIGLIKPGGRVIHHVPMNNWVNHGFYQFSPTLFFDFYEANGFTDMQMFIHMKGKKKEYYLPYDPCRNGVLPNAFGSRKRFLIFFTALKPLGITMPAIQNPIQGRYRQTFGKEHRDRASDSNTFTGRMRKSLYKRLFPYYFNRL